MLVLLISLGFLLAYAFEAAGLSPSLADFLGFLVVGLIAAGTGLAFVMKAIKSLKQEPIAPEKTLRALREIKPGEPVGASEEVQPVTPPEPKRSSAELEAHVSATREEIKDTAEEIREHLTARHYRHVLKANIQEHPVRAGLIGAGTGLATGLLLNRKRGHHNHD